MIFKNQSAFTYQRVFDYHRRAGCAFTFPRWAHRLPIEGFSRLQRERGKNSVKTTIKLSASKSVEIEPCKRGGVIVTLSMFRVVIGEPMHLTPDQCGELIFGLEQAINANDQQQRQGASV